MLNRDARRRTIPAYHLYPRPDLLEVAQHELALFGGVQEPRVPSQVLHEGCHVRGRSLPEVARQAVHGVGFWTLGNALLGRGS